MATGKISARERAVAVCRIVLGAVFVFSAVAKSADPWGAGLKVDEYLTAFGVAAPAGAGGWIAAAQNIAEMLLGVSLLSGAAMRLVSWAVMLLMSAYTLLTLVIAVWNPLDDCGCFGAALRLSNWATFGKNVVLLAASVVVWRAFGRGSRRMRCGSLRIGAVVAATIVTAWANAAQLRHLAWHDGLPFAVGRDLRTEVMCSSCEPRAIGIETENTATGERRVFALDDPEWQDESQWRYLSTVSPYDDLPDKVRKYNFEIWCDGVDVAADVAFADGVTCLVLVRDAGTLRGDCASRIGDFVGAAREAGAAVVEIFGADAGTVEDARRISMADGRAIMDRKLMAAVLGADAGVVIIADGTVAGKYACRDLGEALSLVRGLSDGRSEDAGRELR